MNKIMQLLVDNKAFSSGVMNVSTSGDVATIYAHGVVYPEAGISAAGILDAVNKAGGAGTIVFNIHTPGGSVFEGREIVDIIRNIKAKTIAHIGSVCASAGTSIALACDEVEMADGAHFMIHNANGVAAGDKAALRKAADLIEKIEGAIVNDYTGKTGKSEEEVRSMMDATTWMTAKEALENGFIDRVSSAEKTKNTWNLSSLDNVPAALLEAPPENQEKQLEEPAAAGFFMSASNANRLKLAQL